MLNLSLLSAKPPACENSSLTPPYPTTTSSWHPGRGGCTLDLISLLWKLNPRVSEKKNGAGVGVGCGEKYICDVRDKIETGFSVCRRRLREGAKHRSRWIRWVTVSCHDWQLLNVCFYILHAVALCVWERENLSCLWCNDEHLCFKQWHMSLCMYYIAPSVAVSACVCTKPDDNGERQAPCVIGVTHDCSCSCSFWLKLRATYSTSTPSSQNLSKIRQPLLNLCAYPSRLFMGRVANAMPDD